MIESLGKYKTLIIEYKDYKYEIPTAEAFEQMGNKVNEIIKYINSHHTAIQQLESRNVFDPKIS